MDAAAKSPGGSFSGWLGNMQSALEGGVEADVPCGSCTACCASSQFVHVGPDETDALDRIPKELLFPAPRMGEGHVLLGYDEHGRCPLLSDVGCSIYDHRPQTCRTYDCRIFEATGVEPDQDKPLIAEQARQWQFDYSSAEDRTLSAAVVAAANYVTEHEAWLPVEFVPRNQNERAVLAVDLHSAFLDGSSTEVDVSALLERHRHT